MKIEIQSPLPSLDGQVMLFLAKYISYWVAWRGEQLGADQNWISPFYLLFFEVKTFSWIEFVYFNKQMIVGFIVRATVIKSEHRMGDVRFHRQPGSHGCGFSTTPDQWTKRSLPLFHPFQYVLHAFLYWTSLLFHVGDVIYLECERGKTGKIADEPDSLYAA